MPSAYCHYLCGEEALSGIESSKVRKIIETHKNVFNIGTQGPDLFFYYDSWPFKTSKKYRKTGGRIHCKRVSAFFESSIEYISSASPIDQEILLAYMFGYISHYRLDANAHPYVFYKTGLPVSKEQSKLKYDYYHRRFETALDVIMLNKILEKTPPEVSIYELLKLDSYSKKAVSRMYQFILNKIYSLDICSSDVETAFTAIIQIQKISRDRTGIKKRLIEKIESLSGNFHLLSSAIHPKKISDRVDYLNLKKKEWAFPWNKDKKSRDTFIDLFEKSSDETILFCEEFYNLFKSESSVKSSVCPWNDSFYTGLDADLKLKFLYFDLVYE